MTNPLQQLHEQGQSVWLDDLSRRLLDSGDLRRLIEAGEVWGVTSNPTILDRAIEGSADYDDQIRALVSSGATESEIYDAVVTRDVREAADILRPVYEETNGQDGRISLEVAPTLAHDTGRTIDEAKRLCREIDRPNLFIKVPATPEGLPAIAALIGEGISVNVTLVFGLRRYREVVEAYLTGLETLRRRGRSMGEVTSVASFFVSRVDRLVDQLLAARTVLGALQGKAAIANARLAYQVFVEAYATERFRARAANGAEVQRPLWASTSTKNPAYRDVLYVEELIGPSTVDTMPLRTLEAFRDHGRVQRSIDEDVEGQRTIFARLAEAGIDMGAVAQQLEDEGVQAFTASYEKLMASIRARAAAIRGERAAPSVPRRG